jgi:hypothetical protein
VTEAKTNKEVMDKRGATCSKSKRAVVRELRRNVIATMIAAESAPVLHELSQRPGDLSIDRMRNFFL